MFLIYFKGKKMKINTSHLVLFVLNLIRLLVAASDPDEFLNTTVCLFIFIRNEEITSVNILVGN